MQADTGLYDLITLYDVRALLTTAQPGLGPLIGVDSQRPRLTLGTAVGVIALERIGPSWSIVAPGLDASYLQDPSPHALAAALLDLQEVLGRSVMAA